MSCKAEIVLDSIGPSGVRLTTFSLTYPRVIHAELMTHRQFSRNASSSRAIPWERMRQWILDDPYVPLYWGRNQKGMQAGGELSPEEREAARLIWLDARDSAIASADSLFELGLHKQIVNRLVEPFGHINVLVTATDFANWFSLRVHEAAMPEIQQLAVMMARAYLAATPEPMEENEWHLPYITADEHDIYRTKALLKLSTARCARVSYKTHDGKTPTAEEDFALFERLLGSDPKHASPSEHQARAVSQKAARSGNLMGWVQHRKTIVGESAPHNFDLAARLVRWEGKDFIV